MPFIAPTTLPHDPDKQVCPYCAGVFGVKEKHTCPGIDIEDQLDQADADYKRKVWPLRDSLKELAESNRNAVLLRLAENELEHWQVRADELKEG